MSPDGELPEIVERPDHPWFIGVQFHPELKSKPFDPHPLFASFIEAAVKQSRLGVMKGAAVHLLTRLDLSKSRAAPLSKAQPEVLRVAR